MSETFILRIASAFLHKSNQIDDLPNISFDPKESAVDRESKLLSVESFANGAVASTTRIVRFDLLVVSLMVTAKVAPTIPPPTMTIS